jgi:signal transduction histidine kinase
MRIQTRLKIIIAASTALIIIMALLLFWSQRKLAAATKANDLAVEIIISVFERNTLRTDYLRNDNQRAKDQWFSKQSQIIGLLKKAVSFFDSAADRKIIRAMLRNVEAVSAIFQQTVSNREITRTGLRQQAQATEIENRLVGQLLLKSYDTIADARKLQETSSELIEANQQTASIVFISIIVFVVFFVSFVAWSLKHVIGKGVAILQQGAAAIGAGNLRHRFPIAGEDEFTEVARAFNTMSGKLAESYAALAQEIEERKRTADKIEQMNQELSQTVSQLQGANKELDAFAYSVSHNLRAPLRAMSGFSEALLEDFGDKLEGEARAYLDEIVVGSRHMAQLIDGLLTLSRSTRGELKRDRVDLSEMADHIRGELERYEPQRRVEWQIEPGLRTMGDERMIEVVMRNLLGNAWKYTSSIAEPIIRVFAEMAGSERLFCVADNGAGFDMAHAEKLFQPFQRLHRQDEFPGIGIGLATAQRIVHRHGGTLQGTGVRDKGATFRFSLPFGKEIESRSIHEAG